KTCAETLALAAIVDRLENGAQGTVYPVFGDLGAIFRPIGFHQARARILRMNRETLLAPELENFRIDLFGGLIYDQPTHIAIAHDAYAVGLRQYIFAGAGVLLRLLVLRILAKRCC